MRIRVRTAALAVAGATLLTGCHGGAGPVFGYAFDRGAVIGWEAGGGVGPARGNIGQSFRRGPDPASEKAAPSESEGSSSSSEMVSYLVAEPWLYAGATLGGAFSDKAGFGLAAGLWEGFGGRGPKIGDSDNAVYVSFAIGFRYLAGASEIYFTPKVGLLKDPDIRF